MGRFSPNPSKSHRVRRLGSDHYRISWVVDRYYRGSRLRHPTLYSRDTDLAGARRFAKRWKLDLPVDPPASS
ncbi:MAG: hypothetical protein IT371_30795 [Deltaproteobacteria bacterium]|nr:hypothetical protein [Deltaproteobacteria bacterium]